ncbi:concanavalin A-like lectin/glucanase domain-containing protein, partial [Blyttiomyces helicus]
LPTCWNPKDKAPTLDLSASSLRVVYSGTGKDDKDAAAVRANHPIPPQCGLFYYEVTVVSKGRDGYIGIGFCIQNVKLGRLPGWEEHSWGYHGDDGHTFSCSGTGKAYGPTYATGDVIGCCINFMTNEVSFTKNGVYLGVAFRDIFKDNKGQKSYQLYPSVGLRTPGEIVEANFGQSKFKFDITNHFKVGCWRMSPPPLFRMDELILSYLVHHGYGQTAQSLYRDMSGKGRVDAAGDGVRDMEVEGVDAKIRASVLSGDIDTAISLTAAHYPTVFTQNRHIILQLRCQKFLELFLTAEASCSSDGATGGMEIYSLLAYPNPRTSPVSYLLDPACREPVADILNSAILGIVFIPPFP